MHTQTGHVEAMNAMNIGWILILKDNQPGMYAAASTLPWDSEPILYATAETGHGRHEVRTIRVTSHVPELIRRKLPAAAQLTLIERYRHDVRGRDAAAAPPAGPPPPPGSEPAPAAPRHPSPPSRTGPGTPPAAATPGPPAAQL